ncbi:MAG: arginase family protein [Sphingobacteriales bacterium]|nr:arginase family protein [Sphingobacteriales bacterium]
MIDLSQFDPNSVGNPNNNVFGLPFTEEDARLVILPVPWEVTVSYNAGTARAPEHVFKASLQVDLFDRDAVDVWKHTPFGFYKAIAEKHGDIGILQIDAHCDLRVAYENFKYSHASVMYNALEEIPQLKKLVQVGIRDYCEEEWNYITKSENRVVTYFDKEIKERQFEGQTWKTIADEIVNHLPQQVFISFDIDGLDPKLCPHTGTPVQGGFETEQVFYLFKKVLESGRKIVGFDLNEIGVSQDEWDENVGARCLFKLCNLLTISNA